MIRIKETPVSDVAMLSEHFQAALPFIASGPELLDFLIETNLYEQSYDSEFDLLTSLQTGLNGSHLIALPTCEVSIEWLHNLSTRELYQLDSMMSREAVASASPEPFMVALEPDERPEPSRRELEILHRNFALTDHELAQVRETLVAGDFQTSKFFHKLNSSDLLEIHQLLDAFPDFLEPSKSWKRNFAEMHASNVSDYIHLFVFAEFVDQKVMGIQAENDPLFLRLFDVLKDCSNFLIFSPHVSLGADPADVSRQIRELLGQGEADTPMLEQVLFIGFETRAAALHYLARYLQSEDLEKHDVKSVVDVHLRSVLDTLKRCPVPSPSMTQDGRYLVFPFEEAEKLAGHPITLLVSRSGGVFLAPESLVHP